jgi:hypothetical protein
MERLGDEIQEAVGRLLEGLQERIFARSGEVAWTIEDAVAAAREFAAMGLACRSGEVWAVSPEGLIHGMLPAADGGPPGVYGWELEDDWHPAQESWEAFCLRAAAYVAAELPPYHEQEVTVTVAADRVSWLRYTMTPSTRAQCERWLEQRRQPPQFFGAFAPSQEAVGERLAELARLGFRPQSEFLFKDPIADYAARTLIRELALQGGELSSAATYAVTWADELLARADELFERFGVRPVSYAEYQRLQESSSGGDSRP